MKPQSLHAHEDRLLDFAYGELPPTEARAMESHLQGCARCTEALQGIRGVRATMSQLSTEPAPDMGLESLLAYAQQSARRAAEGPVSAPSRWRRWLMPAMGLAAVSFLGIVSHQVSKSVQLSPSFSELAQKSEEAQQAAPAPAPAVAAAPAAIPEEVASAAPAPVQAMEPAKKNIDFERPERKAKKDAASVRADWSNAGSAGGFPEPRSRYASRDADDTADRMGDVQSIRRAEAELDLSRSQAGFAEQPPLMEQQAQAAEPAASPPPPPPAPAVKESKTAAVGKGSIAADEYAPKQQAQKPAPTSSSLRLGGLSSSTRGGGSASGVGSLAAATGAPAPAPAAAPATPVAAAAPAEEKAASADEEGFDSLFGSSKKASRKAEGTAVTAEQFSQRANEAYRMGERAQEARLLRQALAAGASGRERLGLLIRLCDAEFALGRREAAIEACGQVLSEDPDSAPAQVARQRLNEESRTNPESREAPRAKRAAPADEAPAAPASAPAKR
ncbi:zf-HC2 domain-containing protein [Myxococcaceae bacterium GXIMD 01537]